MAPYTKNLTDPFGKIEQPQNCFPGVEPAFAVLLRISRPHLGHNGAADPTALLWGRLGA